MAKNYYRLKLASFIDDVHSVYRALVYHEGSLIHLRCWQRGQLESSRKPAIKSMVKGMSKCNEAAEDSR